MSKVTFILPTSAEIFAAWLLANWREPHAAGETGSLQGQRLIRHNRTAGGAIVLTADVVWVSYKANDEGAQQAMPFRDAFSFVLQPLTSERVEVTAACNSHFALLDSFARVLEEVARRWPELRDSLEWPAGNLFDWPPPAENETQQALLDAFEKRLWRLKERPGQHQAPARPSKGPQLTLVLEVPTTSAILTTWLQRQYGDKRNDFLTNVDGSSLDIESDKTIWQHNELGRVTLEEDIGHGSRLYTAFETYLHGQQDSAARSAVILYIVRELTAGYEPRSKVTIHCWPVRFQVFDYLASVLANLLEDYPTAGATLVHYVLYDVRELPTWLHKHHEDFLRVLERWGSRQGDYLEDHVFRYANEVEEAKRAARDDPPAVITSDAGANEPAARDDPFAKWDPNTVTLIEQLSIQGKKVAFIVTETGEPERTVVRIRAALAEAGRIKRKKDR